MRPLVRPETSADAPAIAGVHRAAFPTSTEADLVERLRAEGALAASLVAASTDECLGHIALSRAAVIGRQDDAEIAWLAPLAVLPAYQHRGIGSALIKAGVEACKVLRLDGIVVVGDKDFYGRFAFTGEAAQGLKSRFAGPHLMALPLGTKALAGTLTEPEAFSFLA